MTTSIYRALLIVFGVAAVGASVVTVAALNGVQFKLDPLLIAASAFMALASMACEGMLIAARRRASFPT